MKRLTIITLLLMVAAFSFSQTNGTFNNLDVRGTSKQRGAIYPFGAAAKTPIDPADNVLMLDLGDFKMIRVDFQEFADSITAGMAQLWYLVPLDTIKTNYNVVVDSSFKVDYSGIKFGYNPFNNPGARIVELNFNNWDADSTIYFYMSESPTTFNSEWGVLNNETEASYNVYSYKDAENLSGLSMGAGNNYIDLYNFQDGYGIIDNMAIGTDSLNITADTYIHGLDSATYDYQFYYDKASGKVTYDSVGSGIPTPTNYWTYTNAATDTLKNNVSNTDGIIFLDSASLELPPTTATVGQIKQSGVPVFHTYHEKGDNNLFIGQGAGNFTADSSDNVGIGKYALKSLTNTPAHSNLAIGNYALENATTGYTNVGIGHKALNSLVASQAATAIGYQAMQYVNNTGSFNPVYSVAVGYEALRGSTTAANNTGGSNIAIGYQALRVNTTGTRNTALSNNAGIKNTIGSDNIFIGYSSGELNVEGLQNTAVGTYALKNNGDNDGSTAIGYNAMLYADNRTTGERITYNTAIGWEAMKGSSTSANNTGQYNTATGYQALDGMTSGAFNTVYGYDAGGGITTGDSNILIGTSAGAQLTTESDRLFIDNTNTTTPLVWGNMRTDSLRWNADVAFVKDLWYEDTYWRDATTSATALAAGVNAPAQRTIIGGIKGMGYAPSTQNDISYGQVQLNHDYKFDTDIHAHMHFMIEEAGEAGDTAVFALEYSWADIDETFPTSDTMTVLIPCAAITAKQHKLVEFGDITTPGGNMVSSSIIFRLERLQDSPHDTYDGANEYVIVLDVDYHIEIDAPGSRGEIIK